MGKIVSGLSGLFGAGSGKQKAAAAQAQLQQQVAQVDQRNAANEAARRSGEAYGQAAKRRRGLLLLDTQQGKASLG